MAIETLRGRRYTKELNNLDKTTKHAYDKTQSFLSKVNYSSIHLFNKHLLGTYNASGTMLDIVMSKSNKNLMFTSYFRSHIMLLSTATFYGRENKNKNKAYEAFQCKKK